MTYETVIGLEIHAQLSTASKIFCGCTMDFGTEPNSQTCPICLGMPGTLPVLNKRVVEYAMRMALATQCAINTRSVFARKNYFYPDLPKGYQISQYDRPLCEKGFMEIEIHGARKRIGLTRIHIEEDAGKLIHDRSPTQSHVDLNRCGTPLIEIVSEPDLRSAEEAGEYFRKIHQILRYLDICDGNMEEGSLRCDANVSIRPVGETMLGTRTEMKNLNSFRNVERAIEFEIARQIAKKENGETIEQETLLWDAATGTSRSMRDKEDAHDYRYFPEPDLMELRIDDAWIEAVRSAMPELPDIRVNRFVRQFGIPEYDAAVLTENKLLADYYEKATMGSVNPKAVSNWVMTDVMRILNEQKILIKDLKIRPEGVAELVNAVEKGLISGKIAKTVFLEAVETGESPKAIIESKGLVQISDSAEIEKVAHQIIDANPAQVQQYKTGKKNVLGFFVGEAMKATKGKANPKIVNELLRKYLDG
ncbi:MAG: aspartyl/glutamyl-tRNA amidotransferase subunit B [Candidatus Raymondbacteria bacterium RifOxyA12_full_50_37]|nr:MAG: aspartyl/glutamyl-tRNA amidotransferase subunit B [Candidatus Raymondbacteria bacterium RifOxyB12_full_50_8]OGJ90959.1 MAG: aspartyl/glutamyl-tRNA amidotransferase subunit B [Candidatus Raymondbacteria bacterium RifOxyA12_full_50_37]OGJ93835.1 MAG: aspartyl/glutamyl-tRNA amidotransferase subunit B [Candidatus Raymondbacteria bacterium RIFOXYA2_FULL_49_16]OGJ98298.1 MAG: aspartyl/glutamyl-tRNA amidotransferase subunit B [Candidatus Raymondbacteria bacterium RIFOXYC2_FULL_50_21]OGP45339.1